MTYIVALKTLDLMIFTLKYELFILTIFSFIIYPEKQPTNSNLTEGVADWSLETMTTTVLSSL